MKNKNKFKHIDFDELRARSVANMKKCLDRGIEDEKDNTIKYFFYAMLVVGLIILLITLNF